MGSVLRSTLAVALLLLAFSFAVQAVEQVNYKINIVSPEGNPPSKLFARLVEGEGPYAATPDPSQINSQATSEGGGEPVFLRVFVLENISSRLRPVRGAPVNITMAATIDSGLFLDESSDTSGTQVPVASGLTNWRGIVIFMLSPGNYSVLVQHFGLFGNFSVTLPKFTRLVSVRWVFHDQSEKPLFVQFNDLYGDGLISPGENVTLFYRSTTPVAPGRITMVVTGRETLSTNMTIVSFTAYSHGILVVLSPLQPIPLRAFEAKSTLQIETFWYEVSATR